MKCLTTVFTGLLAAFVLAPLAHAQAWGDRGHPPAGPARWGHDGHRDAQVFRCRSEAFRYNHCRVDTRGGVQLVRQVSQTRCIEGRNWGTDRNGVWVDRGCDAEFVVGGRGGYGGHGPGIGQSFRCRSEDYRYNHCRVDVRGGVHLVRQISRADCIQGRTWGTDRNGIWVDRGCDAEFRAVSSSGRPGHGSGAFRCRSEDFRYAHCPMDTRRGVQLVRQISQTQCVQGRNWGTDRNGVWVDRGCDAEFVAGGRRR